HDALVERAPTGHGAGKALGHDGHTGSGRGILVSQEITTSRHPDSEQPEETRGHACAAQGARLVAHAHRDVGGVVALRALKLLTRDRQSLRVGYDVGLRSSVPARTSQRCTSRSGSAYGRGSTRAASDAVKIAAAAPKPRPIVRTIAVARAGLFVRLRSAWRRSWSTVSISLSGVLVSGAGYR